MNTQGSGSEGFRRVTASALLLAACLGAAVVHSGPARPRQSALESDNLLMFKVDGDSVDFRLVDPQGRVAVISVDSAMSTIPGCSASKSSWIQDHDDSDWEPDSSANQLAEYGGGSFDLDDPPAGEWLLEALATRGCKDSCTVWVGMWSIKNVNQDEWRTLRPGQSAQWLLTISPRAARATRVWASIKFQGLRSIEGRVPWTR